MIGMKRLFNILCAVLLLSLTACQYDEIRDKLRDHEQRIEQLEKQCRELNSNVQAVQAILNALQQNDYVTEVMKIMEGGVEVGYSLTFSKSGTITIYHGTDGTDGSAPSIGIKKASDGAYYWTSNGEWITDDDGNKIPATVSDPDANYVTPQFRVADGVWYVSYDNGNSWRILEQNSNIGDSFFKDVQYDGEYICFTLFDDTKVVIPLISKVENHWTGKKMIWNGDSISYGSWLGSPETDAYPYLVGKTLGMETYNFAIGGSYAAKPKGSFEEYYWDYDKWLKDIEDGVVDITKKYLVKDYVNAKKPCRIYYYDGAKWKANSETGGWAIVERMKEMVALHPDADVIGIAIGTNDFFTSACPFGEVDAANYRNLEELRKKYKYDESINLIEQGERSPSTKLLKDSYTFEEAQGYTVIANIPVEAGYEYRAESGYRSWFLDADKNPLSTFNLKDQDFQFTAPANAYYVSITFSGDASGAGVYGARANDGTMSEEEKNLTQSTFCGAIHTICKYLLDNYKNKDIIFVTPIKRCQGWCQYPEDKNSLGYTLKDYSDAIIEICSYYSIPVIDFYSNSGLNPHIDTSLFGDTDGKAVHPNEEGHRRLASLVVAYLKGLRHSM